MFLALFVIFLVAGWIHALKTGPRTRRRFTELLLVYPLVGYFGILMLVVAVYGLAAPARFAASHGWAVSVNNPFQQFLAVAYGAMAIVATLAVWLRGRYLIGPAGCWSLFFLGATYIHVVDFAERGREITFTLVLRLFATHGLMSVVLIALLALYLSAPRTTRTE